MRCVACVAGVAGVTTTPMCFCAYGGVTWPALSGAGFSDRLLKMSHGYIIMQSVPPPVQHDVCTVYADFMLSVHPAGTFPARRLYFELSLRSWKLSLRHLCLFCSSFFSPLSLPVFFFLRRPALCRDSAKNKEAASEQTLDKTLDPLDRTGHQRQIWST